MLGYTRSFRRQRENIIKTRQSQLKRNGKREWRCRANMRFRRRWRRCGFCFVRRLSIVVLQGEFANCGGFEKSCWIKRLVWLDDWGGRGGGGVFDGRLEENLADMDRNRSFLARAYPTMKKNNPHTPIMLREAAGTQPRVYARYG